MPARSLRVLSASSPLLLAMFIAGCGGGNSANASGGAPSDPPASTPSPTSPITPVPPPGSITDVYLGSVSHFGQGWSLSLLTTADTLKSVRLRDQISWNLVEAVPGHYDFSSPQVSFIDTLVANGFVPTLVFDGANLNYDGGSTPYTDSGRAAFARFVSATLTRFPSVQSIEIGNEFNGDDFVSGPVKSDSYDQRDDYYFALLKAVHDLVRAQHPDVKIIGGAAHSIPVGYFRKLFALGALNLMDSVSIHPYTTPAEQFAKQIALLRSAMGNNPLPIAATEFSQTADDDKTVADYLIKQATAMAAAGVEQAHWYALEQQGTAQNNWFGNTGLATVSGALTAPGSAFKLFNRTLFPLGRPVRIDVDDFTFAYRFGRSALVIWGEPRSIRFLGNAQVYSTDGNLIPMPAEIDPDHPIIIVGNTDIAIGSNLILGASSLLADSYYQFDYTNDPSGPATFEGPWSYWTIRATSGEEFPLYTQGGGEIRSSNWTPYMGLDWLRPFSVDANAVSPVDFGSPASPNVYKADQRYTAKTGGKVDVKVSWNVIDSSLDGVDVTVRLNGVTLYSAIVQNTAQAELNDIILAAGDRLDFITGTNKTPAGGDTTDSHIQIFSR